MRFERMVSLILCWLMIFSLNVFANEVNTTEQAAPYSTKYVGEIDGATYVRYASYDDFKIGSTNYFNHTLEMYDTIESELYLGRGWDSTVDLFREKFVAAGFNETESIDEYGDKQFTYKDAETGEIFLILGKTKSEKIINEGGLVYIEHCQCDDTIELSSSESTMIVTSNKGEITIELDSNKLDFDVPPQIVNDRTMVPVRAIFESLGASIEWDENTRTVTSIKDNTTIKMTVNSEIMYVDDKVVELDTPAMIIDNRTFVPVRAISEAYGVNVEFVFYADITSEIDKINDQINQGLFLEAIDECDKIKSSYPITQSDTDTLDSLKANAQHKYDEYLEAQKEANKNKKVTDSQKQEMFATIKKYASFVLKSPSTAIWPDYTDVRYYYNEDGIITAFGTLEAMNGFGGYGKVSFWFKFSESLAVESYFFN